VGRFSRALKSEVGVARAERLVVPHLTPSERRASAAEVEHVVSPTRGGAVPALRPRARLQLR
jgi:hypothetical protein